MASHEPDWGDDTARKCLLGTSAQYHFLVALYQGVVVFFFSVTYSATPTLWFLPRASRKKTQVSSWNVECAGRLELDRLFYSLFCTLYRIPVPYSKDIRIFCHCIWILDMFRSVHEQFRLGPSVSHSQGCTSCAMDVSAMRGHLDVVQWLTTNREEGCTTNAMDWAAKEGKLVGDGTLDSISQTSFFIVVERRMQSQNFRRLV